MNQKIKQSFLIICTAILLTLSVCAVILLSVIIPNEGKTVEYRLESVTERGHEAFPKIRQVIENGADHYIYFPGKTMDEGIEIVNKLNATLK